MNGWSNRRLTSLGCTMGCAVTGVLAVLCSATISGAKTMHFAPLPMQNRETIVKQFKPMMLYLEQKLGCFIEFEYSDSYKDLVEKFSAGKVDIAYLGPLPYVELHAMYPPSEPVVKFNEESGNATYTCAITHFAGTPVKLEGLRDAKIALTQPLSTCGYLSVRGLLKKKGSQIEENHYQYLDKHDAVALAVIQGEYQLGGLKTAIAKKYTHLGLTILEETPPFPAFSLVANTATLSAEEVRAIQQALIDLDPKGKDRESLETWGEAVRYGAIPAQDADFNTVREYKSGITIPDQGK